MRTQVQAETMFQEWSDDSAMSFPAGEDRARQEFKDETDVNVILRRFGAGGFEVRPVQYGIQETDLELQTVYAAAAVAEDGWLKLPEHVRKRYSGWPELLSAVEAGQAVLVDKDGVVSTPPADLVVPVSG